MSIRSKYESELALVFNKMVGMCHAVELAIEKSITALRMRDTELAREVMQEDKNIDNTEREIEQDCLKILLMERPVASDFRDVSAALKMITDLERIADHCSDISEYIIMLSEEKEIPMPEYVPEMIECTKKMIRETVDAFVSDDKEEDEEV